VIFLVFFASRQKVQIKTVSRLKNKNVFVPEQPQQLNITAAGFNHTKRNRTKITTQKKALCNQQY